MRECHDLIETFVLDIRNDAIDEILKGIEREKNYHDYIDKNGDVPRSAQLACLEIAGYVKAVRNTTLKVTPSEHENQVKESSKV